MGEPDQPLEGLAAVLGHPVFAGDGQRLYDVDALIDQVVFQLMVAMEGKVTGDQAADGPVRVRLVHHGQRQRTGGEWQRVRLAAVVLQITPQANPAGQLLLLDEPMNSLDVAQQSALDKILSALCQQGLAIVMSSHDLNHTLRHAHRAWLLKGGKMLASGRREEVLTPPNLAQAYGMNFRRLDIEGHRMLISTI